jgi:hypothetical protein
LITGSLGVDATMLTDAAKVPAVNVTAPGIGEAASRRPWVSGRCAGGAVLAAEQVSGMLVTSAALWLPGAGDRR